LKIRIEERTYEGTGVEIMNLLRLSTLDPTEYPDTECYIRQLQANFVRMTDMECALPDQDEETQARAMFAALAKIGALEVLEDG